jgi:molybdopterin-guanine dinucleotide biosynthesis protein A
MINKQLVGDVTGVILAGGKSNRMGINKSLLKIDDVTLIERIYDILKLVFDNVIISTNDDELYDFLPIVKVEDVYKEFGPLSGIHASLKFVATEKIFVVSSDLPFLLPALIQHLLEVKTDEPIVLPKAENRIQYLCGIYSKSIFTIADNILSANSESLEKNKPFKKSSVSLWNFVERIGAEIVDVEEKVFYMKDIFFNINTPEDFEYARDHLF